MKLSVVTLSRNQTRNCLFCGVLVTEDFSQQVWVRHAGSFHPLCNVMHHDAYYNIGLWKEELPQPQLGLALDDDDEE